MNQKSTPATAQQGVPASSGSAGRLVWPHRANPWLVCAMVWLCLCLCGVRQVRADDVAVPIPMQVQLLASVADYDKAFAERAKGSVKIVLLTSKDPDSARAAAQVRVALRGVSQIAGLPHEESIVQFESAAALRDLCRSKGVGVVFVMPGFQKEVADIKRSLDGVSVLSVATVGAYVQEGVVLGFDVISGKPKLLVNLPQARAQKVAFKAELLKMVKVIE